MQIFMFISNIYEYIYIYIYMYVYKYINQRFCHDLISDERSGRATSAVRLVIAFRVFLGSSNIRQIILEKSFLFHALGRTRPRARAP